LCVWQSGPKPVLIARTTHLEMLRGRMAILWTGRSHVTPSLVDMQRDYATIRRAGEIARCAVAQEDYSLLCHAVRTSYQAQLSEGMPPLPFVPFVEAAKYIGSGHGGYALYLFPSWSQRQRNESDLTLIEPYARNEMNTRECGYGNHEVTE
jgi:hypothetical protein